MIDLVVIEKGELRQFLQDVISDALKTKPHSEETLDTDGIAAFLHVSSRYVATMVDEQGLPATFIGKGYRARRRDLEAWWDQRLSLKSQTTSDR